MNVLEYHRPHTVEAALQLLSRVQPLTLPMGGGTQLTRKNREAAELVDLQDLGLDQLEPLGNSLRLGAAAPLQKLVESEGVPQGVREAALLETSYNLRQVGTVAGTLVAATSRSPFAAVLLAMDARLTWMPGSVETSLGEWLPVRMESRQRWPGVLIVSVTLPLNVRVSYHQVARTPADWPLVCAAAAHWPSGRRRLVLGGAGAAPMVVMDGPEGDGYITAARSAYDHMEDQWASAEYRREMAGILAGRCAVEIEGE
jgi:putative selenate reductase FAD-binding subunit